MGNSDFHEKRFDEGTLTKLELFQLYTQKWLPVFLAQEMDPGFEIHLYDFFAGPGSDSVGVDGSPLRTLRVMQEYSQQGLAGWNHAKITAHFFDSDREKIGDLRQKIATEKLTFSGVTLDIGVHDFTSAFAQHRATLENRHAAKLLLIDQFGVDIVTPEVFRQLIQFPRSDFLFFISSNTLRRFREHPAIKQKIPLTADHYQVHRAVLEYYRGLVPAGQTYYLAPFSIMKGPNIYGVIFGSRHLLGMDKFLDVAWKKDRVTGEANFDIDRDNLPPDENMLPLDDFRPTKVMAFERALTNKLRTGELRNEVDAIEFCFGHGVTRQHARPVLKRLASDGVIAIDFEVPDIRRLKNPRTIRLRK
jgi:three-Cys-motif partner protein